MLPLNYGFRFCQLKSIIRSIFLAYNISLWFPQDDKDLVHEFVTNDGLQCLITVGTDADQNYQNYILRGKDMQFPNNRRSGWHKVKLDPTLKLMNNCFVV